MVSEVPQYPPPSFGWYVRFRQQRTYDRKCLWPLSASSGREQVQQGNPYSITSSARTRNVSGMANPIALAALRLITKSNFVGCSMGSSAGLAPLNILSTYIA